MASEPTSQAATANTGTLLLRAFQMFENDLLEALAEEGHLIRAKHGGVLANLDTDGTRLTELARRAGIGKPAVGELVDELEQMGLVERVPDPTDGRAKLVIPTKTGTEVITTAAQVIAGIEARYQDTLGVAGYEALRAALLTLTPHGPDDIQPRISFAPSPATHDDHTQAAD